VKILHVIVGLDAGGAEHVLRRLIESHRGSLEFQHSVVSLTDIGKLGIALVAEGVSGDETGSMPSFPRRKRGKDSKEYTCRWSSVRLRGRR
jgi:hypothetical protein